MHVFLFRSACFHASLPISVLSLLQFLSPIPVSLHSSYFSISAFFLSASGLFPLVNTLGSGYLAGLCTLKTEHRFLYAISGLVNTEPALDQAFGLLVSVS